MEQYYYLLVLLISIFGIAVIDRKYRLAFWEDKIRTLRVLVISVAVFIVWDILGIKLGVFFSGSSEYMMPYFIVNQFPVEEIFFLILLTYSTLNIHQIGRSLWPHI
jgi:lycopene cyclase domain-containing protein